MRAASLLVALFLLLGAAALPPAGEDDFLGRWDLTVTGEGGRSYPSWLEVTREGGTLKARFVGRGGSVFPVPDVTIDHGELNFKYSPGRSPVAFVYKARLKDGRLEGTLMEGSKAAQSWTGARAPAWPKVVGRKKPGKPVALFNGRDLAGWLAQNPNRPIGWTVKDAALANEDHANNIYSEQRFSDFKLEVEFNVAEKSNSGIYLRGRYEIQVLDDYGLPPESHRNGAIYGFLTPSVNASKHAGEWQTVEATIIANRVTVILNRTKIIDDQEIPGITGGALDSQEAEPGPILLQGDHGPVLYRKVVVTPLK